MCRGTSEMENQEYISGANKICTIKWFDFKKGYGFVQDYFSKNEYFLHIKNIGDKYQLTEEYNNLFFFYELKLSNKHQDKLEAKNLSSINEISNKVKLKDCYLYDIPILNGYEKKKILQSIHKPILIELFIQSLAEFSKISNFDDYKSFINFLKEFEDIIDINVFEAFYFEITDDYYKAFLWVDSLINDFNPDYIKTFINDSEINHLKFITRFLDIFYNETNRIIDFFVQIPFSWKREIISRIDTGQSFVCLCADLDNTNNLDFEFYYSIIIESKYNKTSEYQEVVKKLYTKSDSKQKVILWLNDLIDSIDSEYLVENLHKFNPEEQDDLFKKMFNYKQNEKIDLTFEHLEGITNHSLNNGEKGVSLSILIAIKTIIIIKKQESIDKLYAVLSKYVAIHNSLDFISTYFEDCNGRTYVKLLDVIEDDKKNIKMEYFNNSPLNIFCEGRLNVDEVTNLPKKDAKFGLTFYWCRGSQCFQNSLSNNKDNALFVSDFLDILGITNYESKYSYILGYINRINEIIEHIKCRVCSNVLYPAKESNYGFHRINLFRCGNQSCTEYLPPIIDAKKGDNKTIYLSHCMNGFCNSLIDSRRSAQCSNNWYICENCLSCCSSKTNERRVEVYKATNQKFISLITHREKNEIFCPVCSSEVLEKSREQYTKIFNWFESNKTSHRIIGKSGINKLNKNWWMLKKNNWSTEEFEEKLKNLNKIGFEIPQISEEKEQYLVSGYKDINKSLGLTCSSCSFEIDFNANKDRAYSILKYHDFLNKV